MGERISHRKEVFDRYLPKEPEALNTIGHFKCDGRDFKLVNVRGTDGLVKIEERKDVNLLQEVFGDFVTHMRRIIS